LQPTAVRRWPGSTLVGVHVGDAAAGLVDTTALPLTSTATQSEFEAHATPETARSILAVVHTDETAVGLFVTNAIPL
jgi:hypothetical protein